MVLIFLGGVVVGAVAVVLAICLWGWSQDRKWRQDFVPPEEPDLCDFSDDCEYCALREMGN